MFDDIFGGVIEVMYGLIISQACENHQESLVSS